MSSAGPKVTLNATPSSLAKVKEWSEAQKTVPPPFLCFRPSELVPPMPLCLVDPVLGEIKEIFNKAAACSPTPSSDDCKAAMALTSMADPSDYIKISRMEDFNEAMTEYLGNG